MRLRQKTKPKKQRQRLGPLKPNQKSLKKRLQLNFWLNNKQSVTLKSSRSTLNWLIALTNRKNKLKLRKKKLIKWPKNAPSKNSIKKKKISLMINPLTTTSLK